MYPSGSENTSNFPERKYYWQSYYPHPIPITDQHGYPISGLFMPQPQNLQNPHEFNQKNLLNDNKKEERNVKTISDEKLILNDSALLPFDNFENRIKQNLHDLNLIDSSKKENNIPKLETVSSEFFRNSITNLLYVNAVKMDIYENGNIKYCSANYNLILCNDDTKVTVSAIATDYPTYTYEWLYNREKFATLRQEHSLTVSFTEFGEYLVKIFNLLYNNDHQTDEKEGFYGLKYSVIRDSFGKFKNFQLIIVEHRMKRSIIFLTLSEENFSLNTYIRVLCFNILINNLFIKKFYDAVKSIKHNDDKLISSLSVEVRELTDLIDRKNDIETTNIEKLQELAHSLNEKERRILDLSINMTNLASESKMLKEQIEIEKKYVTSLTETSKGKEEHILKLVASDAEKRNQIEILQNELNHLKKTMEQFNQDQNNIEAIVKERMELLEKEKTYLVEIDELKKVINKMKKASTDEIDIYKKINDLSESCEKLKSDLVNLTKENSKKSSEINSLSLENECLKKEAQKHNSNTNELIEQLKEQKAAIRSMNLHFAKRLLALKNNNGFVDSFREEESLDDTNLSINEYSNFPSNVKNTKSYSSNNSVENWRTKNNNRFSSQNQYPSNYSNDDISSFSDDRSINDEKTRSDFYRNKYKKIFSNQHDRLNSITRIINNNNSVVDENSRISFSENQTENSYDLRYDELSSQLKQININTSSDEDL